MKERPSFPARLNRPAGPAKGQKRTVASGQPLPGQNAVVDMPPGVRGLGLDSSAVRMSMVRKLEAQGIRDPRVLSAMGTVERHRFVDSALVNQAYEDTSLPIGLGQTISKPGVVARMLDLLLDGRTGHIGRVLVTNEVA